MMNTKYRYHQNNYDFTSKWIFVFGSNLRGIHGAGAAQYAFQTLDAKWGQGIGLQGWTYAIPTKNESILTLPVETIESYVKDFLEFAELNQDLTFFVTQVGCGLAGYTAADIAPMFKGAPVNCVFPENWVYYLEDLDKE